MQSVGHGFRKQVASVAVMHEGNLLMGRRRDNGRWTLPGGHLNDDEDHYDGAKRELFEEAGITVPDLQHLGTSDITTHTGKLYTIHAFRCEGDYATSVKNDPDKEVVKWEWIDTKGGLPKEIMENLHSPKNSVLHKLGLQDDVDHPDYKLKQVYDKLHLLKKSFLSRMMEKQNPTRSDSEQKSGTWYHGSPSGELKGSRSGIHLGTKQAAHEALTARIGHPAEGEWDGSRKYGETKLAGQKTMKTKDISISGHNCEAPEHDYLPREHPKGLPKYSDGNSVDHDAKPEIAAYKIKGEMSNSYDKPHSDAKANGLMAGSITRGTAKRGMYYRNDGEDAGSVSAVVPHHSHLEKLKENMKKAENDSPENTYAHEGHLFHEIEHRKTPAGHKAYRVKAPDGSQDIYFAVDHAAVGKKISNEVRVKQAANYKATSKKPIFKSDAALRKAQIDAILGIKEEPMKKSIREQLTLLKSKVGAAPNPQSSSYYSGARNGMSAEQVQSAHTKIASAPSDHPNLLSQIKSNKPHDVPIEEAKSYRVKSTKVPESISAEEMQKPIVVAKARNRHFVLEGHERLAHAIAKGHPSVKVVHADVPAAFDQLHSSFPQKTHDMKKSLATRILLAKAQIKRSRR